MGPYRPTERPVGIAGRPEARIRRSGLSRPTTLGFHANGRLHATARHMSLKFFIYDIQWPNSLGLPGEATISLSDELVEATELEEDEWHDAVNDQLQRQFGERAVSFQMTGDED